MVRTLHVTHVSVKCYPYLPRNQTTIDTQYSDIIQGKQYTCNWTQM